MNPDEQDEMVVATRRALAYAQSLSAVVPGLAAGQVVLACLAEACDSHELGDSAYSLALIGMCQHIALEYRAVAITETLKDEYRRSWHLAPPGSGLIAFKTQGPPEEKTA